ncbi:L-threonine 3-dehydrogenase [Nocardioides nitrophenolicus]|uniref:L-threonine 3-dehydrogenase n=1 Tax=Nocardioides nitrophenolicus TaxID=60489 RepID=UPI001958037C|nr:L-threonine 3-dehydrogenase [Nocardioides nitrophenolicus]MBM7518029.1 threonine 3-dehydrogenase [Nocardioides nitrophenolicus]
MFALRKTTPTHGFTVAHDVPVPEPGAGEVLVAVSRAGVCGTDKGIYEWAPWTAEHVTLGTTVGHEFVGRVAAVGPAVTRVREGQRVSGEGHLACGSCPPCRTGRAHVCESVRVLGAGVDGCFADYVLLPEANLWPVHDAVSDDVAAILDPIGNAMHTVMTADVAGRSVLVTGAGVIGAISIAIARAAGAGTIIATDLSPRRLELALEMGADHALPADDPDWPEQARRLTRGSGPDVLLEMSGSPTAIRQGLRSLGSGGTAALLGVPTQPVELDLLNDVVFKGATIHGVFGRRMFETWYQVENFLVGGRLRLDPVISHRIPFRDYDRAFELMSSGEAMKIVLVAG